LSEPIASSLPQSVTWIGRYVVAVALIQIGLHFIGFFSQTVGWIAFGVDQHFWLFLFILGSNGLAHGVAIAAEIAVLGAGSAMLEQPTIANARRYLWLESILTAPSLLFFVIVFVAGLSSSHGMSPGEVIMPFVAALITAVAPCLAARWCVKR
jgi:hypothetical protein